MENKNNIAELMTVTMTKLRDMVDVNTIVGDAITTADGTTIIPVSRLSMGVGSGGSEFGTDSAGFGGGGGAGMKVTPVAFLVVSGQEVKLLPMEAAPETILEKIIDAVPKVVNQVEKFIEKRRKKDEDEE